MPFLVPLQLDTIRSSFVKAWSHRQLDCSPSNSSGVGKGGEGGGKGVTCKSTTEKLGLKTTEASVGSLSFTFIDV